MNILLFFPFKWQIICIKLQTLHYNIPSHFTFFPCSWRDRVFGMCWMVYRLPLWTLHVSSFSLHNLVLFQGKCTSFHSLMQKWACGLRLCCLCSSRPFRSTSALSSSGWVALQTGNPKDQVRVLAKPWKKNIFCFKTLLFLLINICFPFFFFF